MNLLLKVCINFFVISILPSHIFLSLHLYMYIWMCVCNHFCICVICWTIGFVDIFTVWLLFIRTSCCIFYIYCGYGFLLTNGQLLNFFVLCFSNFYLRYFVFLFFIIINLNCIFIYLIKKY